MTTDCLTASPGQQRQQHALAAGSGLDWYTLRLRALAHNASCARTFADSRAPWQISRQLTYWTPTWIAQVFLAWHKSNLVWLTVKIVCTQTGAYRGRLATSDRAVVHSGVSQQTKDSLYNRRRSVKQGQPCWFVCMQINSALTSDPSIALPVCLSATTRNLASS